MLGMLVMVSAAVAAPALSPAAATLVAPVHAAYAQVAASQAHLRPATSTRERLERMYDMDQAGRAALQTVDVSKLPPSERAAANAVMWSEISAHDAADQLALKSLMTPSGWFTPRIYGRKAATAAFLIVQHAVNDPPLMRDVLARLKPLAETGQVDGGQYALMYDRVSLDFDHKPQRYGSQLECKAGRWQPVDLEDPANVDARRRKVGLTESEAAYLAHAKDMPCS